MTPLDEKLLFGRKTVCLGEKLLPNSKYAEFDDNVYLSCFGWEIPFLGKFGTKIKIVCLRGQKESWYLD